MDKVQSIIARINELHGEIDALRAEVESNAKRLEMLQPKMDELARVEDQLKIANSEYHHLVSAVASAQADYEKMRTHFNNRPF